MFGGLYKNKKNDQKTVIYNQLLFGIERPEITGFDLRGDLLLLAELVNKHK